MMKRTSDYNSASANAWGALLKVIIDADRLGKIAIALSMSSKEEEDVIRSAIHRQNDIRVAVTAVGGMNSDVKRMMPRTVVNSAMKAGVVRDTPGATHALIHAGLEALGGLLPPVPGDSSLKLKIAIAANTDWVAVAAYGQSAFLPETNHERLGLGVMHL